MGLVYLLELKLRMKALLNIPDPLIVIIEMVINSHGTQSSIHEFY